MIGVTGSTGKTSTKDILRGAAGAAPPRRSRAAANLNTEIGLPLAVLARAGGHRGARARDGACAAPARSPSWRDRRARRRRDRQRRPGRTSSCSARSRRSPRAKAELIAGLRAGRDGRGPRGRAAARRRTCATTSTPSRFGAGRRRRRLARPARTGRVAIDAAGRADRARARLPLRPTCASTCSPRSPPRWRVGVAPARAPSTVASRRCAASASTLAGGVVVINDCYNANPMSMRAALDDLAATAPRGGASPCSATCSSSAPTRPRFHREIGAHAARARRRRCSSPSGRCARRTADAFGRRRGARARADAGEAAALRPRARARPGDTVLVKASRGVGLEGVAEALATGRARRLADGRGPDRGHRLAADLHLPVAEVHRVPARARVRPAHPRGGAGRATTPRRARRRWAGSSSSSAIVGAVPDPRRTATGARSASSARRSRARCSASPTTTRRSSSAARSGCAARTKLIVHAR